MSSNQRSAEDNPDTTMETLVLTLQTDVQYFQGYHMGQHPQRILENQRGIENVRPPTPRILNNFLDPAVRTDFLLDGWDEVVREIPDFHALPELVSDESDDEIYSDASMAA